MHTVRAQSGLNGPTMGITTRMNTAEPRLVLPPAVVTEGITRSHQPDRSHACHACFLVPSASPRFYLQVLFQMVEVRQATSISCNSCMAACSRASHWQKALHLMRPCQMPKDSLSSLTIQARIPWIMDHGFQVLARFHPPRWRHVQAGGSRGWREQLAQRVETSARRTCRTCSFKSYVQNCADIHGINSRSISGYISGVCLCHNCTQEGLTMAAPKE